MQTPASLCLSLSGELPTKYGSLDQGWKASCVVCRQTADAACTQTGPAFYQPALTCTVPSRLNTHAKDPKAQMDSSDQASDSTNPTQSGKLSNAVAAQQDSSNQTEALAAQQKEALSGNPDDAAAMVARDCSHLPDVVPAQQQKAHQEGDTDSGNPAQQGQAEQPASAEPATNHQQNSSEREGGQHQQLAVRHRLQSGDVEGAVDRSCVHQQRDQCANEHHVGDDPESQTTSGAPQHLQAQQFAQERPIGNTALQTQEAPQLEPEQGCHVSQIAEHSSDMHVDRGAAAGMLDGLGKEAVMVVEVNAR